MTVGDTRANYFAPEQNELFEFDLVAFVENSLIQLQYIFDILKGKNLHEECYFISMAYSSLNRRLVILNYLKE